MNSTEITGAIEPSEIPNSRSLSSNYSSLINDREGTEKGVSVTREKIFVAAPPSLPRSTVSQLLRTTSPDPIPGIFVAESRTSHFAENGRKFNKPGGRNIYFDHTLSPGRFRRPNLRARESFLIERTTFQNDGLTVHDSANWRTRVHPKEGAR